MPVVTTSHLLDGPLFLAHERGAALALRMAEVLIAHDAFADRGAAVRCLRSCGYSIVDVDRLVDAACTQAALAIENTVAAEIAAS